MSQPAFSFGVELCDDLIVDVFIWHSHEDMYAHTRTEPPFDGCYESCYDVGDGCLGTIHLVSAYIGAGYVAHEIQHAILDWIDYEGIDIYKEAELVCDKTGLFTSRFWKVYYRITMGNNGAT